MTVGLHFCWPGQAQVLLARHRSLDIDLPSECVPPCDARAMAACWPQCACAAWLTAVACWAAGVPGTRDGRFVPLAANGQQASERPAGQKMASRPANSKQANKWPAGQQMASGPANGLQASKWPAGQLLHAAFEP